MFIALVVLALLSAGAGFWVGGFVTTMSNGPREGTFFGTSLVAAGVSLVAGLLFWNLLVVLALFVPYIVVAYIRGFAGR